MEIIELINTTIKKLTFTRYLAPSVRNAPAANPAIEYDNAVSPKKFPLTRSMVNPARNPVIEPKIFPSETDIKTMAIRTKSGVILRAESEISQIRVFCTRISTNRIAIYLVYFIVNLLFISSEKFFQVPHALYLKQILK